MSLTVNTNVASLNAQNNLGRSSSALQTSLERLSSGSRINSAKDDAAGLQIANRLTSQINGLGVAVRNANDGISLAQTAEGALQESTNILQRMRDLSLQSANGGLGDSERKALNDEVVQLKNELDRISTTTKFGSKDLFGGSFAENIQVGAQANETISVKIDSFRTTDMGTRASRDATAANLVAAAGPTSLTITDTTPSTVVGSATAALDFDNSVAGSASVLSAAAAPTTLDINAASTNNVLSISGGSIASPETITLADDTYTSATLASAINAQIALNANLAGRVEAEADADTGAITLRELAQSGDFSGNELTVAGNGATNIFATVDTGTGAVQTAGNTAQATFDIDLDGTTQTITLDQDYTGNVAGLVSAIQSQIDAGGALNGLVQVTENAGVLSLTQTGTLNEEPLTVTGTHADALFGAGRTATTGTAGGNQQFTLALNGGAEQTITIASGNYTTLESLADNINQQIAGNTTLAGNVRATVNEGRLAFVTTEKSGDASVAVGAAASGDAGLTNLGFAAAGASAPGVAAGAKNSSVEQIDITTVTGAQSAIATIDAALSEIDSTRASLGAIQNRFESTISNLQNVSENVSAARGRVMDTDFAAETANLTKNQILQQAGTSILAQANQLPQAVLSLLG